MIRGAQDKLKICTGNKHSSRIPTPKQMKNKRGAGIGTAALSFILFFIFHPIEFNGTTEALERPLRQSPQADGWTATARVVASLLRFSSQLEDYRVVGIGTADAS